MTTIEYPRSPEASRAPALEILLNRLEIQIRYLSRAAALLVVFGSLAGFWALFQFDSSPNELSQLGDFFSGAVTALWSLAGLLLIYVAFLGQRRQIIHQEEELALNRFELQSTREELRGQKEQLELQRFETTFFQRLHLISTIVAALRIKGSLKLGRRVLEQDGTGREVFRLWVEELSIRTQSERVDQSSASQRAWHDLFDRHESHLGQYLRTLFHLLLFVDTFPLPFVVRKDHVDLLRAQLSKHELLILFSACTFGLSSQAYENGKLRDLADTYELFRFLKMDSYPSGG
jgi:hypothetical protein